MLNYASYFEAASELITRLSKDEGRNLDKAAIRLFETVKSKSLIHVFGSGHSHMGAEELFERAGGIAGINPILDVSVMPMSRISSNLERAHGFGKIMFDYYAPKASPGDTAIIISNSGRNPLPIEVALEAKARGVPVIALTSVAHAKAFKSRHGSGKLLVDFADIVVDTHVPAGDAAVDIADGLKAGPLSTIAVVCILNDLVVRICRMLAAAGIDPPIFRSANVDGSENKNAMFTRSFEGRGRLI